MPTYRTFNFGSHSIRVASTPSGSFFHAQDVCNALSLELPATSRTGTFDRGERAPILSEGETAVLGADNAEFSAWLANDVLPVLSRQAWEGRVLPDRSRRVKGAVVPGSAAAQFGAVLRLMPAFERDWQQPDSCPVLGWIAEKCDVSRERAGKIFNAVRQRSDIIVFVAPHWMGVQTMKLGAAVHFAKGGAK